MPRHRREHVPLYRALRPAESHARRVPVRAAVAAARTALESGAHDEADDDTAPLGSLAGLSSRPQRDGPAATEVEPVPAKPRRARPAMRPSSPTLHGALRGVLVNPWFAAGAGLVIAASMWLYAPQTQLSFPHEAIGRTKCQVQGCAPMVTAPDGGSVATSSGQPISPSVRRHARRQATADVQTKSGSPALAFGYSVVSRHRRRFALELTVTSSKPITNWTLSFAMDGDRIRSVFGANWQPASTDSGAASGLVSADGGHRAAVVRAAVVRAAVVRAAVVRAAVVRAATDPAAEPLVPVLPAAVLPVLPVPVLPVPVPFRRQGLWQRGREGQSGGPGGPLRPAIQHQLHRHRHRTARSAERLFL